MADFESVPPMSALAQMLINLQQQGFQEKMRLAESQEQTLRGQAQSLEQSMYANRQRSDTDRRIGQEQAFRTGLAGTEFQNRMSAGREEDRLSRLRDEDARAFAASQAATAATNLSERERQDRLFAAGQAGAARGAASQQAGLDRYFQSQRDIAARQERGQAQKGAKELGYARLVAERRDAAAEASRATRKDKATRLSDLEGRSDAWGQAMMEALTPEQYEFAKSRFDSLGGELEMVGGKRRPAPPPPAAKPEPSTMDGGGAAPTLAAPKTLKEAAEQAAAKKEWEGHRSERVAKAAAPIAKRIEHYLPERVKAQLSGGVGLGVKDRAAASDMLRRRVNDMAGTLATVMDSEWDAVMDLTPNGVASKKSPEAWALNRIVRMYVGGEHDPEKLVAEARKVYGSKLDPLALRAFVDGVAARMGAEVR